jgi:hypothetical protein
MGILTSHRAVTLLIYLGAASSIWAQNVTVRNADQPDPRFKAPAVTFLVENRNKYDLSICVTDEWNTSAEPIVNDLTPFYLESFSHGKWHEVIGNDMADHFISWLKAADQESFSIHNPDPGTYRVVMLYRKREELASCQQLNSRHPHRATSAPFTVP